MSTVSLVFICLILSFKELRSLFKSLEFVVDDNLFIMSLASSLASNNIFRAWIFAFLIISFSSFIFSVF